MAFVKYEPVGATKPAAGVRIGPLGITISNAALEQHHLADADYVSLYWDADTNAIAIEASDASDKSAFAFKERGKAGSKFIAAGKFYDHFAIQTEGISASDGQLVDHDGFAAFQIVQPRAVTPRPSYSGKPRGRRKKAVDGESAA